MSFRQDAARLRRQLAGKGFSAKPKCPICTREVEPRHLAPHSRQCERDCASLTIEAIDRRLAAIWSTEPRGPEHATLLEVEAEWIRHERAEAWNIIFGLTPDGKGTVVIPDGLPCPCGRQGCTHDETAF